MSWLSRGELTAAEEGLLSASEAGCPFDALTGGSLGDVRSRVLFQLLTGAGDFGVSVRKVELNNANVQGHLDLSDEVVDVPFTLVRCQLTQPVLMPRLQAKSLQLIDSDLAGGVFGEGAHLGTFSLANSRIGGRSGSEPGTPSLILNWAHIGGMLGLSGVSVQGEAQLVGMTVENRVDLVGAQFRNPGGVAVGLDSFSARGSVFARRMSVVGEARAIGAQIGGDLSLSGSRFEGQGMTALALDGATISGSLQLSDGFVALGDIRLVAAQVGLQLSLESSRLQGMRGEPALIADGLRVNGQLRAGDGLHASGEVRFVDAELGGSVFVGRGRFENATGTALNFSGASIRGSLHAQSISVEGEFRLTGARIERDVELAGSTLRNINGRALNMDRAQVGGNLNPHKGFRADGEVNLIASKVEGGIDFRSSEVRGQIVLMDCRASLVAFRGARIAGTTGIAILGDRAAFPRGLIADDLHAVGECRFPGASVGGELTFRGARLICTGPDALNLETAVVAGPLNLDLAEGSSGRVNLGFARVDVLDHTPNAQSPPTGLRGFTFARVTPGPLGVPVSDRIRWVASDPSGYQAGAFASLAAAYAADGHDDAARDVMIAGQRMRYESGGLPARTWGFLKRITVAYGYRPGRSLLWLLAWLFIGTAVLCLAPGFWEDFLIDGSPTQPDASPIGPALYLLDSLIPVLELPGHAGVSIPNEGARAVLAAYLLVGLTLGVAASVAILEAMIGTQRTRQ